MEREEWIKIGLTAGGAVLVLGSVFASAFACHLGTTQFNKAFVAARGQDLEAKVGFFNLHGDRITHVVITGVTAPKGWETSYTPQATSTQYNISGLVSTVNENFALEPITEAQRLATKGVDTENTTWFQPEGLPYYIPLSVARLKIKVPETGVKDWDTYEIVMASTGSCFDLAAMAEKNLTTVAQARDFTIKVKVVPDNYFEEKIVATAVPSPSATVKMQTGAVVSNEFNVTDDTGFLLAVLVLCLGSAAFFYKRRNEKLKPKPTLALPIGSTPVNNSVGSGGEVNTT